MNRSSAGLILMVISVTVYIIFISNSGYVSAQNDHNREHSKVSQLIRRKRNVDSTRLNDIDPVYPVEFAKSQSNVSFNICCGSNQNIKTSSNECVDSNNDTGFGKIRYIFERFLVDGNMSHIRITEPKVQYGFDIENICSNHEIISEYL